MPNLAWPARVAWLVDVVTFICLRSQGQARQKSSPINGEVLVSSEIEPFRPPWKGPRRSLDASVIMPVDFLRVPMAALVGFYAYGEGIDVWVVIGGCIILMSNFQAMMSERMRSQTPNA